MDRTADISGTQKKILDASARPARVAHGSTGIAIQDGTALPFIVERRWSAPAGYYPEQWFLIDPQSREILYDGPEEQVLIWGLQSWTDVSTTVEGGFPLAPGKYQLAFALGGTLGAEVDVEAVESPAVDVA